MVNPCAHGALNLEVPLLGIVTTAQEAHVDPADAEAEDEQQDDHGGHVVALEVVEGSHCAAVSGVAGATCACALKGK
eukprot:CAMPEP_0195097574 /NCGR_PEP_ID=MMETSP0448-20130528/53620_1 /TAXON_ID=66468 /ORGANISM="Heterocapsa triquestra, Strain CCMP 448" /LENGTH=76 /DNA_ID=CAMNT_0040132133 /DNA_START=44 /DNA_END=274 /DNA_ORIENTATION=+